MRALCPHLPQATPTADHSPILLTHKQVKGIFSPQEIVIIQDFHSTHPVGVKVSSNLKKDKIQEEKHNQQFACKPVLRLGQVPALPVFNNRPSRVSPLPGQHGPETGPTQSSSWGSLKRLNGCTTCAPGMTFLPTLGFITPHRQLKQADPGLPLRSCPPSACRPAGAPSASGRPPG